MDNRWYVFRVVITSKGEEERNLTPYDDKDTAIRKYHEAFNVIGAGPTFVSACILDRYMNQEQKFKDYWQKTEQPQE